MAEPPAFPSGKPALPPDSARAPTATPQPVHATHGFAGSPPPEQTPPPMPPPSPVSPTPPMSPRTTPSLQDLFAKAKRFGATAAAKVKAMADAAAPDVGRAEQTATNASAASSGTPIGRDQLPPGVSARLFPEESVRYFSYIDFTGRSGCASGGCATPRGSSTAKRWLLVSDQRILFEATVTQGSGAIVSFGDQSGSIPIAKVSFVGVSSLRQQQGCAGAKTTTALRINSSGGEIVLAIPTQQEAARAQVIIDRMISQK